MRVACVLILSASQFVAAAELTVLFTSDMHAHVLPYDEVRERPARGSIAQIKSFVDAVRSQTANVLVLDGGDAIQGTPLAHYALTTPIGNGQDPTIAAMNLVGYDAAVLGNHEFNFGLGVLRRSLAQANFPWLAANLVGAQKEQLAVHPHLVIKRGGIRIAIIGLTNPNIPHWDPPSHLGALAFTDPVAAAAAHVAAVRAQGADLVIVVLHAGFERDLDSGEADGSDYENFAWRVAQVPGIDLLLTGHTHEDIPPRKLGNVIVAQPGRWAELVTRIDLKLERQRGKWRLASWTGSNVPMATQPAHGAVAAAVEHLQQRVQLELAKVVGRLEAPLVLGGVPTRDDPALDLVHEVQLAFTGAQLSLAAPLAGNRYEVPAGPLPMRVLHGLYPYPNTLMMVALSGAQLRDVAEHAVRGWKGLDCTRPPGCTLLRDPQLPYYNFDTLQGATYFVDPLAPVGQRVRNLRIGGKLVEPNATYTLAINSYRAVGGGNYPHLSSAPRLAEIDRPMVELLAEYIARQGVIAPRADDNWAFVIPLAEALAPIQPAR